MGNNVGGLNYRNGNMTATAENGALFKEQYELAQARNAYAYGDTYTGMYHQNQAMVAGEKAEKIHDRRWRHRTTAAPWAHGSVNTVNPATGVPFSPLGYPMYGGGMGSSMMGSGVGGPLNMGTLPTILPGMGPHASNFMEYQQYMGGNSFAPTMASPLWGHSATMEAPQIPFGASSLAGPMGNGMGMSGYW